MGNLGTLVGGAVGGGLAAVLMSSKYVGTAAAAAALGSLYPITLLGGAAIGAYIGRYATSGKGSPGAH